MKTIRIVSLVALLLCGLAVFIAFPQPVIAVRETGDDWVRITSAMGIQNMVTAVYLGPRIFDTFVEVMVVILTVYGMKYISERT